MTIEPDDENEDKKTPEVIGNWGDRNKSPTRYRGQLLFLLLACCIIDYLVWTILGPCTSSFSSRVYICVVVTIVGVTTLAAIFLSMDDE